jgi:tRNA (guanine-N7-)-methyltransferase
MLDFMCFSTDNPKSSPGEAYAAVPGQSVLSRSYNPRIWKCCPMSLRDFHDYPEISLKPEAIGDKIDFAAVFQNRAAVEVEIGSGKGTFLVSQAKARPEINFFGIEYTNKVYRYSVDRIGRWGLKNVRIIRAEAAEFVQNRIPDASVRAFHIYYPDPWPKKRHHKRRFFSDERLAVLLRCLEPGGRIQLATDHEDYWLQMRAVIEAAQDRVRLVDFARPAGALEGETVGTNYERKYKKENRPTFFAAIVKIA